MRWLVYSDIHGNLEALAAVWQAAAGQFDDSLCLGDIVGYGASPNQTTEWVRTQTRHVIRGNHDRVCADATGMEQFNPAAQAAALWTHQQLRPENRAWIAALPAGPLRVGDLLLAHGSPLDEDEYVIAGFQAARVLESGGPAIVLAGHTHVQGGWVRTGAGDLRPLFPPREPLTWQAHPERPYPPFRVDFDLAPDCRYFLNPGSVGQPRDRDWRASFLLIDTVASRASFLRVPYDLAAARDAILQTTLPSALAFRLERGQ